MELNSKIESVIRSVKNNHLEKAFNDALLLSVSINNNNHDFYLDRLLDIKQAFDNLEIFRALLFSDSEYEEKLNRIKWALISLLKELQTDSIKKSKVEVQIALAETGKAIQHLISLTKGTTLYFEVLLLSSRYFELQKASNRIDYKELDDIKGEIAKFYDELE